MFPLTWERRSTPGIDIEVRTESRSITHADPCFVLAEVGTDWGAETTVSRRFSVVP